MKSISLEEFSKEIRKLPTQQVEASKAATLSGVARSIPMLVERSPVDTGLYAQSWGFDSDNKQVSLGNYAPHAPIIEHGARPFTPPLKPLLEWAKRVLQDSSQPPHYSPEVRTLAWRVQKKIAKRGIDPQHILENAIPKILEFIKEEHERGT